MAGNVWRTSVALVVGLFVVVFVSAPVVAARPSSPRSLDVEADAGGIDVSWREPRRDGNAPPLSYTVQLRVESTRAEVERVETGATSLTLARPAPGSYEVRVRAENEDGNSGWSTRSVEISGPPGTPRNLRFDDQGDGRVVVRWDAPSGSDDDDDDGSGIDGYRVSFGDRVETTSSTRRSLTVRDVDRGRYKVSVAAFNDFGLGVAINGEFDNVVAPGVPRSVQRSVDEQTVSVTWRAPADNGGEAAGYEVEVGSRRQTIAATSNSRFSATFELVPEGTHRVRVRAFNSAGRSSWTTATSVTVSLPEPPPPPPPPPPPSAFAPFDGADTFLAQQYRDFLGRAPDPAGESYWLDRLSDDPRMAPVIASFITAPELDPERRISRLYLALFDRAPDRGGFDYWTSQYESGRSTASIADRFVDSPEFLARFGALDNGEFVVLVYNRVLARQPDAGGFQHWVSRLEAGMTRGELIARFSDAPEFVALSRPAVELIVLYSAMLRRPPTPSELQAGLAFFAPGGDGLVPTINRILSSSEYLSRF